MDVDCTRCGVHCKREDRPYGDQKDSDSESHSASLVISRTNFPSGPGRKPVQRGTRQVDSRASVRRGSIVQLIMIGVLAGAVASAVALIPNWLPHSASREAGRIDFVFWFVTGICIFVFSIVAAVTLYAVWKFRAAPDDDSDGPPIHGNTRASRSRGPQCPTLLVTAIAIVSAIVLAKDDAAGCHLRGQRLRPAVRLELRLPGSTSRPRPSAPARQSLRSFSPCTPRTSSTRSGCPSSDRSRTSCRGSVADAAHHTQQGGHVSAHLHRALRTRARSDAIPRRSSMKPTAFEVGGGEGP